MSIDLSSLPWGLLLLLAGGVYVAIKACLSPPILWQGRKLPCAVFCDVMDAMPMPASNRSPGSLPLLGHAHLFTLRSRQYLLDWLARLQATSQQQPVRITIPTLPPAVFISGALAVMYR
jgi:hypothetical protein